MIPCSSQILHHPVVVTFIQQSWSNSKSILLSFFTYLLFLIAYSSIISYLMEHLLLFTDPAPPSGGDLHPAELVQQQVHVPDLLLPFSDLPNSLLIHNFLFYDILLFTDLAPPSGGDLHPAELVQQQVHIPHLLHLAALPDSLLIYNLLFYGTCIALQCLHSVPPSGGDLIQHTWSNSLCSS
jgi:hypothetical protein